MSHVGLFTVIWLGLSATSKAVPRNRPFSFAEIVSAGISPPRAVASGREGAPGMFEADIDMSRMHLSEYTHSGPHTGFSNPVHSAVANKNLLWPKGQVPYLVSTNFDLETRKRIIKAIGMMESETCIRFTNRTDQRDYVYFKLTPGACMSEVGHIGGMQNVGLSSRCSVGVILHELMHVIGFFHEQSRSDRDDHVVVLRDNVMDGELRNFDKYDVKTITDLGFPYDYDSIMHYGELDFSRDRKSPTIVAPVKIGQREKLSSIDIGKVQKLYKCGTKTCRRDAFPKCKSFKHLCHIVGSACCRTCG